MSDYIKGVLDELHCAKCGYGKITVQLHEGVLACPIRSRANRAVDAFSGEHLHFTCGTCGWEWAGRSLDDPKP